MKGCFGFLFLCLVFNFLGQPKFEKAIEYRQKVGFLAAHRGVMAHMPSELGYAGELSYVLRSRGSKEYQKFYKYPSYGFTVFYGSVGNNLLLGNYLGTYGFAELPMVSVKNYRMDFKLGFGMGHTSKVYDPLLNPKNVAVSTKLLGMMCLAVKSTYFFGKNSVNIGLDITHFSNAAYKVPNFGINMPFVSIGYARTLVPIEKEKATKLEMTLPYDRWLYSITGILSAKQNMPIGGKRYPVYALNFSTKRFFNHRSGLELDVDLISKQAIMGYQPLVEKSQLDIVQMGIYSAYLVPLDRFHFVFGMGAYIRDKYHPEDKLYHRIGCRYFLKNGLILNFTLKTHWARADYLEYGIGYTFNYRKK